MAETNATASSQAVGLKRSLRFRDLMLYGIIFIQPNAPMLLSLGGLLTCFFLWIHLGVLARIAGTAWALAGVLLWWFRRSYTVLPEEAI